MKIHLNKNIILFFISTITIVFLGITCGIIEYKKEEDNQTPQYNPVYISNDNEEKKDANKENIIEETEKETEEYRNEEKLYTEEWKRYLNLSDTEKKNLAIVPRKYEIPIEKLEEIKKTEGISKEEEKEKIEEVEDGEQDKDEETEDAEVIIPEKFNLNDKIDITIENQGNYGLCWDFASMKSLETHLALTEGEYYDFSEMHLDYMESKLLYGEREIHDGGNFEIFETYNLKSGEVSEVDVPYREFEKEEYENFPEIPEVISVTETVNFPSIYKDNFSKYTEEQITDFRNCVKKHIMQYGAVTTGIYHSYEKCSYLPPDSNVWPDHLVTIVGWDDNYPKENFKDIQPSHDGAYLILNSWGPNANDNGYYYISYDDKYVENTISGVISTKLDTSYKISDLKNNEIKDYIIRHFGHLIKEYKGENYITKSALNQVHTLDLSNQNISSLDGIELFRNARIIDLSNNNISNLTQLKVLKNNGVSTLNLSNNNISDINGLEELYQLEELDLSYNDDIIDISKLENMNNLNKLNTSGCNLSDFSCYEHLTSLNTLDASETHDIINIDKLPINVQNLTLNDCGINSIDELINNDSFYSLYLKDNNIENINVNKLLKNLNIMDISNNPIKDWEWLKNIYYIVQFRAQNCNIEDITILDNFQYQSVCFADLSYNKINDVSNLANFDRLIMKINLSNNGKITGLEGINSISEIVMQNCEIDGTELSKLTNVQVLNLDNSKIDDINEISNLKNIYDLSLDNCNITDIEALNKLENLDILNLNNNKELYGKLNNNEIGELHLANCNLNQNFDFSGCKNITYLDISNNPNFQNLYDIMKEGMITVRIDTISIEALEKLNTIYLWGIEGAIIEGNCIIDSNNQIDLRSNQLLKKYIMKNWNVPFEIDNGVIQKNKTKIAVLNIDKNNVTIKMNGKINYFSDIDGIKILFNSNQDINEIPNQTQSNDNAEPGEDTNQINNSLNERSSDKSNFENDITE